MAGIEDVRLALALIVALIVVLITALHFVFRHNKDKDLKRRRSSPSSDANIPRATSKLGHELIQLNESLSELYKPPGQPNLQILFFHGFQFGDDNAHISTWQSKDENGSSIMWPQTWLREEFPDAHIFSVAYNCCMKESRQYAQEDLFILGENLMADLLEANIGQDRRCPVILVGHSFGGLVMKKLCLFAGTKVTTGSTEHKKFLQNVKGLFFYSTPHGGIKRETIAQFFKSKSPLLENVEVLSTSTSRLNDDFEKLRRFYKDWRIAGVGESSATTWDSYLPFRVVEEASSRYGDDFLIVPGSDHITISRPHSTKSTSFTALRRLVHGVNHMRKVSGIIHLTHGLPDFPSGLEKRVEHLQNLLRKDTSQASILGIVGMGGVGKTTVAKQLFNEISSNYEYTCFVENVKDIPIHALEEKVLSQFCCDGAIMKKGQKQWPCLEKKKTLIIMDDVSSVDQLKKVPKLDHFGIESHLIITSRDRSVLVDIHNSPVIYDVELLTPAEGEELLCQQVFGAKTIPGHYHLAKWVDKVVQKCGGLPLTLEVIGSYIRPHSIEVQFWKETFLNLEQAVSVDGSEDDRVWASLKLSIDNLNEGQRTAFIEAATCFFGKRLDEAFAAWSTHNARVHTSWENLLTRSLVKRIDGRIWVHEHLRDLAKSISQRHSISTYDVNTFTRSCVHDTISMEARGPGRGTESETHFWLQSRVTTPDRGRRGRRGPDPDPDRPLLNLEYGSVQLELFDHMENLKYLYLDNVLPHGLSNNFPQSISLLRWALSPGYGHPKLPAICWKGMHNLGFLYLSGWDIPMEVMEALVEALGSVFKLRSLALTDLVTADFHPADIGNLSSLTQLRLDTVKVIALPDWLGDLEELEVLYIRNLTIPELPKSFGGLCSLKELSIKCCWNLRDLPESFGDLRSLTSLVIYDCKNLRSLPQSFGGLVSLASLRIRFCENLTSLPGSLGHLSCLKKLELENCEKLESLPASFGLLAGLQHLEIGKCDKLKGLPDNLGNLSSLASLKLLYCSSIQELPASIGMLSSLEEFHLSGCEMLQRLPDGLGQLKVLKKLTISKAPRLQALSSNLGNLVSLTNLKLDDCRCLEELPASIGMLSSLEELYLSGCETLQRLPDELGQLKALKKLTISKAPRLQALSSNLGNLVSLTNLKLDDCRCLEELPASIGMLSSLEELYLSGCETLQRLPDELGQLKALKKLSTFKAPRLQDLSSLGNLSALRYFELDQWRVLEKLPANFGFLSEIKSDDSQASNPKDFAGVVHDTYCDDCEIYDPIKGARYLSITDRYSDLCSGCFGKAGSQASYIRISHPPKPDRTQVRISSFSLRDHPVLTNLGWELVDRDWRQCVYQRI